MRPTLAVYNPPNNRCRWSCCISAKTLHHYTLRKSIARCHGRLDEPGGISIARTVNSSRNDPFPAPQSIKTTNFIQKSNIFDVWNAPHVIGDSRLSDLTFALVKSDVSSTYMGILVEEEALHARSTKLASFCWILRTPVTTPRNWLSDCPCDWPAASFIRGWG